MSRIGRSKTSNRTRRWSAKALLLSLTGGSAMTAAPPALAETETLTEVAPTQTAGSAHVGATETALPGLIRIGVPGLRTASTWTVAGSSGYGMSEAADGQSGSHHRFAGSVAVGVAPVAGLDLSLRLAGRRDGHPADAQGADTSYNGAPQFTVRYGQRAAAIAWGGELGVRVPGREAPSLAFDATVVDAKLLLAHMSGNLTLAALAGFRLDQSANAKPDLARTRPGDRHSLGLSDFHAALAGVGVAYRTGRTEWLGEVSADLLLGGPSLLQSPMRVGAGARHHLGAHWQVFALVHASPSERPDLAPDAPLIPTEVRFGINAGFAYQFGAHASVRTDAPVDYATPTEIPKPQEPAAVAEPEKPSEPEDETPATPAGQLRGLIRSFKGRGLKATVRVYPLNVEAQTDDDGSFVVDIPPGVYEVAIEAEGFKGQRREVRVEENGVTILNADLRVGGVAR